MQPNSNILSFFAKYIETELGIIYADHNYFQLQNRLEEISRLMDIPNIEKLYEHAQKGISGAFKQLLLDTATNNETSFFRDIKIFRSLESVVLKAFLDKTFKSDKLKIWSAASSTGQEALSTAMTILEYNAKNKTNIPFSIVGTDISERVLGRAQSASYSQLEVQRGLPAPLLIKYFKKDDQDRWTAIPDLTKHIQYKKLNLKEAFPFKESFQLILCRNVLIYQNIEGKKEILSRMTSLLEPGGYLVLGSGESLLGLSDGYEQIASDGAILYKKRSSEKKAA